MRVPCVPLCSWPAPAAAAALLLHSSAVEFAPDQTLAETRRTLTDRQTGEDHSSAICVCDMTDVALRGSNAIIIHHHHLTSDFIILSVCVCHSLIRLQTLEHMAAAAVMRKGLI